MEDKSSTPSTPVRFEIDETEHNVEANGKTLDIDDERNAEKPLEFSKAQSGNDLLYNLDDKPPLHLLIFLSLQHALIMATSVISYPYILAPALCIRDTDPARGHIISTIFFVCGIATFFQTAFGIRLPIVQGCSVTFLVPIVAIMELPQWKCPDEFKNPLPIFENGTTNGLTEEEWTNIWQSRMAEICGAIIVASAFEILLGITGLIGALLKYITPLGVTPCIALIGLSLFKEAAFLCSKNWPIAIMVAVRMYGMYDTQYKPLLVQGVLFLAAIEHRILHRTIVLITLFSQYFLNIELPLPSFGKNKKNSLPIFKLFPLLLATIISWAICGILTAADQLSESNEARTDLRFGIITQSSWFRLPYPGQFGLPTVSMGAFIGMLSAILSSVIESVGDYYACAKLAKAPRPPRHAINRGIMMEGIGCILAGIFGSGCGLTSFSTNISIIAITRVASRAIVQWAAFIMIIFGLVSKIGAVFATIPDPVIGATFCIVFALVAAVGLSSAQSVDMNSSRNLFILGFSLFMGLMISTWVGEHPQAIKTGYDILDSTLVILLSTSMFVGGFLGVILDNTMPGTPEERGMAHSAAGSDMNSECYDVPLLHFEGTYFLAQSHTSGLVCAVVVFIAAMVHRARRIIQQRAAAQSCWLDISLGPGFTCKNFLILFATITILLKHLSQFVQKSEDAPTATNVKLVIPKIVGQQRNRTNVDVDECEI